LCRAEGVVGRRKKNKVAAKTKVFRVERIFFV
jgi:hypothetical protein